jgi:hypothetical protein
VLAQWRPDEALPLLIQKSAEAPAAARLIGTYLWKPGFEQIVKWAKAESSDDRERADRALAAAVPSAALRATRGAMLAVLKDPKAPKELRHQFALKLGLSSTPAEVPGLLKEYEAAADPDLKMMFATAVFATRDNQAIPLLTQFLKENPEATIRAGALVQLKDMVSPKEFAALAEWTAQNDPEEENRKLAVAALGKSKTP